MLTTTSDCWKICSNYSGSPWILVVGSAVRNPYFLQSIDRTKTLVYEATQPESIAPLSLKFSDYLRIISFRNVLIHNYADVDSRLVWDVVETKLPTLIHEVEALLNEPSD